MRVASILITGSTRLALVTWILKRTVVGVGPRPPSGVALAGGPPEGDPPGRPLASGLPPRPRASGPACRARTWMRKTASARGGQAAQRLEPQGLALRTAAGGALGALELHLLRDGGAQLDVRFGLRAGVGDPPLVGGVPAGLHRVV